MTGPSSRPTSRADAPEVRVAPQIACSAGRTSMVDVGVRHRGFTPAMLTVTVLGLDSSWVAEPIRIGPLQPGESVQLAIAVSPERGSLSALYPFVIAAEITPIRPGGTTPPPGAGSAPVLGIAESTLAVDGRERVTLAIDPSTSEAVNSRKVQLHITNPGRRDRSLSLSAEAAHGVWVHLQDDTVLAPAGRTVSVQARVRVRRPRLLTDGGVHSFALTARGDGAPERVDGTLNARPLIRGAAMKIAAVALVLAVWAAAALLFIPKLSDQFTARNTVPNATSGATAPGTGTGGSGTGGTTGAGTSGSGAEATTGAGGAGSGAGAAPTTGQSGAGTAGGDKSGGNDGGKGGGSKPGTTLSGTVSGAAPAGVQVGLRPTSLIEAADVQAAPAPGDTATADMLRAGSGAFGKIPAEAVRLAPEGPDGAQSTETDADGTFAIGGITGPGYYLLTLAKAGFQTQRFIINSATLAAGVPLDVAMVAGPGRLTGTVTGPDGPVGAAEISITDGTVSLATSTVSPPTGTTRGAAAGAPGTWTADGLSTPGTYLVTASAPGFGTTSHLVTLTAGGAGKVDLTMKPGVAAVTGTVSGRDELGRVGGLGGIGITITNGGITRTATTVTTGPVGAFVLPDLPAPGEYTMTISGAGFTDQVRTVTIPPDTGQVRVDVSLAAAAGVVTGSTVGDDGGGLEGVGLTLTGDTVSYKTMSTSAPAGRFRFSGVAPGTYLLSASTFGRAPASTTVTVTAAGTAQADLRLPADAAIELAATAHIQGRVVDASTDSALTCDRSPVPDVECRVKVTVPVPVDPADDNGKRDVVPTTAGPAEDYVIPAKNDPKHRGLVAGLYTLTISAPGYETTTTQVQVAENQITVAPQIRLQPLGLISGTITTHVGSPSSPSCVIAVPAGTKAPTSCTPSGKSCSVPGGAPVRCSLVAAKDGSYQIVGLLHGSYQVGVLTTDREFLPVATSTVQLQLGGDARYDAVLDRLGRATVTVLTPDLKTVALTPQPGAAVTFTPTGQAPPPFAIGRAGTTGPAGTLQVGGLNGTYTVTAKAGGSARISLPVGLNQTESVTMVLTSPIGAVVGRVTTSVDGRTVSVGGAKVTVSGVVGFDGQTPVTGAGTVTTAGNGCFAILPANWPATGGPALTSPDCPSVPRSATAVMSDPDGTPASLVVLPVTVGVAAADTRTKEYQATATLVGGSGPVKNLPVVIVDASPSPVGSQAIRQELPEGDPLVSMLDAKVTVTRAPAGAGAVTVRSDSGGNLTFTDASLAAPGQAVPGRYSLHVEQTGFVSGDADLLCALGKTCVMVATGTSTPGPLRLRQLAKISGTLRVPAPLPSGVDSNDLLTTFVSTTATGVGAITVSVGDPNAVRGDGDAIVAYTYAFNFRDDAQPRDGLAAQGSYTFQFNLNGYAGATVTIKCGADFVAGCDPVNRTLKPFPRLAAGATVSTNPAGLPAGATKVNVIPPDGGSVDVGVDPTTAALSWKQDDLPPNVIRPGTYRVSAILAGFDQSSGATFVCGGDSSTCDPHVEMTQRTDLKFDFINSAGNPVPDVLVTLTGNTLTAPAKASTTAIGNTVTIKGMVALPTATYLLHTQAAGYKFDVDYDRNSPAVQCDAAGSTGLIPHPGGTTTCTVRLTAIGSISFATVESVTPPGQAPFTNALGSVAVALRAADADGNPVAGSPTFSGVTNAFGGLVLTGTKVDEGLLAGRYLVTATRSGHGTATGTVLLSGNPGGTYGLSDATGDLTITGGALQVTLPINPVPVQIVLASVDDPTKTPIMQPMTATLSGPNGTYTCNYQKGQLPSCATEGDDAAIDFPAVNPGTYQVQVAPQPDLPLFNPVSTQIEVREGQTTPLLVQLFLQLKTNNQRVVVNGPGGVPLTGAATVDLMQYDVNGLFVIAKDFGGDPLELNWPPAGPATELQFTGIPDGLYYVQVTAAGYDTFVSPQITLIRAANPAPSLVTANLTRAARTVDLTVQTTAKGPAGATTANLAGTELTLTQTAAAVGQPVDPLTGIPVAGAPAGPFTASLNQPLATGDWQPTTTKQTGIDGALPARFRATGSTFTVTATTGGTTQSQTTLLHQGLATLTASWNKTDCTDQSPINGTLPITVTRTDGTNASVTVQATVSGNSATANVLLPAGTYSWAPDLTGLGDGWTAPSGGFPGFTIAVPNGAAAGSVDPKAVSGTLGFTAAAVTATLTLDGSPGSGSVRAFQGAAPGPTDPTLSVGTPTCLSPGAWKFRLAGANAHLDDESVTLDATKNNTVAFTGYSLIPRVALADVANRAPDSVARAMSVTVTSGGTTVFAGSVTIPSGQSAANGTTQIVPTGAYSLAATNPVAGDVFAAAATAGSLTIADGSTNHTITGSFGYTASTLRLTTSVAVSGNLPAGATVELFPADPNHASWPTVAANGAVVLSDVTPGTRAIIVHWQSGGTYYQKVLPDHVFPAGISADIPVVLDATTTATIALTVDGPAAAVTGATVRLIPADPANPTLPTVRSDGTVLLTGITPGTYDIAVSRTSGGTSYLDVLEDQVLTAGPPQALSATLTATTTGTVIVRPVGNGAPLPAGSTVTLLPDNGSAGSTKTVDSHGNAMFTGLSPTPNYHVAVSGSVGGTVYSVVAAGQSVNAGLTVLTPTAVAQTTATAATVLLQPTSGTQKVFTGITVTEGATAITVTRLTGLYLELSAATGAHTYKLAWTSAGKDYTGTATVTATAGINGVKEVPMT